VTVWEVELTQSAHDRTSNSGLGRARPPTGQLSSLDRKGLGTRRLGAELFDWVIRHGEGVWHHTDRVVLCFGHSSTATDEARYAYGNARSRERQAGRHPYEQDDWNDNEHDVAAREFFAKHGYRPLTEAQSNAITLIGIVRARRD
jgi:hypothetical protein